MDLSIMRHSTSHVLAAAVKRLFPNVKLGIGPAIENGFYYDFDLEHKLTPEDFEKIEKEMEKIIKEDLPFEKIKVDKEKAKEMLKGEEYKLELLKELKDEPSFYKTGDFIDLCSGPHVKSTKEIQAFKLTKIAGAYWRGNSKNKMLQRIYGIAFESKKDLRKYLTMLEEAEKRDHRKLGKQMDLFSFHEEGPGFPFFHPKGTFIYNKLVEFMRNEMLKRDYEENRTPIILNKELWLKSGHWDNYKENMYFTEIDKKEYAVKPMNCPGNLLIYKTNLHSYKELPIRAGEFGLVHRHELSGVLSGLFRVRVFTQDDAHVFCTEDQVLDEVIELIDFIDFIYKSFGFEYNMELSTRPEKSIGSDKQWEMAERILKEALEKKKIKYKLNPGDGAFYGPKIDYHLKDAIGRTWQCGTIQLDFSMPEKFDLEYDGKDGRKHRPVMLHRAIYGSIERFLGILIEHYAGKFPLWLSPVQVKVLTINDKMINYADKVVKELKENGIRVETDYRTETIPKKVRDAQIQKVNYMVIIGEKEEKAKALAVRNRKGKTEYSVKLDKFIEDLKKEEESRK